MLESVLLVICLSYIVSSSLPIQMYLEKDLLLICMYFVCFSKNSYLASLMVYFFLFKSRKFRIFSVLLVLDIISNVGGYSLAANSFPSV